jgi:hypothetical protein
MCDLTWRPDGTSSDEALPSNDPSALDRTIGLERLERDDDDRGRRASDEREGHKSSFSDAGRTGRRV